MSICPKRVVGNPKFGFHYRPLTLESNHTKVTRRKVQMAIFVDMPLITSRDLKGETCKKKKKKLKSP